MQHFRLWLACLLWLPAISWAQSLMPVDQPLKTRHSQHFTYIYQPSVAERLPELARHCEDAYAILTPLFKWTPAEKITVLFADPADLHNGLASSYPEPFFMVFASDTAAQSTVHDNGNTLRRTVFHEITHVLDLDAQYGFDAVMASIFGRVVPQGDLLSAAIAMAAAPPAVLAPNWYIEGLATWVETEFVGPGRGRNALSDMILRQAVAQNRLLDKSRWHLSQPSSPHGSSVYQYGVRVHEHAHRQQPNAPAELAHGVHRSWAFFFDRSARAATGKSFNTLAQQAMRSERQRQQQRLQQLQKVEYSNLPRLTPSDLQVTAPRYASDGQILFSASGDAERSTLFTYNPRTRKLHKTGSRSTGLLSDLSIAGDQLYFTRLNVQHRQLLRSELKVRDLKTGRTHAVNRHQRHRFISVDKQQRLLSVRDAGGRQGLYLYANPGADQGRRLYRSPAGYKLIDPTFSPNGRHAVFVEIGPKQSRLLRLPIRGGKPQELLSWEGLIQAPEFSPNGRHLIISADRSGVFNLYASAWPKLAFRPLTHTAGGVFSADFSADGKQLAAVAYDADGFYLTKLNFRRALNRRIRLPQLQDDWPTHPANQRRLQAQARQPAPTLSAERDYRSAANIGFDYWTPWLAGGTEGIAGGVATQFSDLTGYQTINAFAGAESEYGTPVAALNYRYAGWYPVLNANISTQRQSYPDLLISNAGRFFNYEEEVRQASLAITLPIADADYQLNATTGVQYRRREVIEDAAEDYAGQTLLTNNLFTGNESNVFASVSYFNGTAFRKSHSIEDGRLVNLSAEISSDSLGGDLNQRRLRLDWSEYFSIPVLENHVLKLTGTYGTGNGDVTTQGLFGLGGIGGFLPGGSSGFERTVSLRGYNSNAQIGDEVIKAGAAYRFPAWQLYRGFNGTTPIYLKQLFVEFFYEGGQVRNRQPQQLDEQWFNSFGFELNFGAEWFRVLDLAPGIGVAYATDKPNINGNEGEINVYLNFKTGVNF